jgi:benzoyl-CoA reductase/2-hydroxyglutaryl-CoA dehydratase subunit BcrC/BadD/HgdB
MSDLVDTVRPELRVFKLMVPTVTHTEEAVEFMAEELRVLKSGLEEMASGQITATGLKESIELYNQVRAALGELQERDLDNRRLYAAYLAAQLMDPKDFCDLAQAIESGPERPEGTGVALVGGPVPQLDIYDLLQEYGMSVVWDDLCTASRFTAGAVSLEKEPLRALAEHYLWRTPCPTKLDPENHREKALLQGVNGSGAAGVVFMQQNFCEFHSFDYPHLKKRLDSEGIPSIRLDLEQPFRPTGQMRTRLQALSEILAERV